MGIDILAAAAHCSRRDFDTWKSSKSGDWRRILGLAGVVV